MSKQKKSKPAQKSLLRIAIDFVVLVSSAVLAYGSFVYLVMEAELGP